MSLGVLKKLYFRNNSPRDDSQVHEFCIDTQSSAYDSILTVDNEIISNATCLSQQFGQGILQQDSCCMKIIHDFMMVAMILLSQELTRRQVISLFQQPSQNTIL